MNGGRPSIDVRVEVSTLAHATEDEDKVARAIRRLLPEGLDEVRLKRQVLSGYHRDPLTLITARIRKKKGASRMLRHVIDLLPPLDRERLLEELGDRVDEAGNLYIRLDKQKALWGKGALKEADPIRLKFGIRVPHGRPPLEYIGSVLVSLIEGSPQSPAEERE
jgi:RNA binding exosome subunit